MDFLNFLSQEGFFKPIGESRNIISATTVIALSYKNGALMVSDSQATMQNLNKFHQPIKKIFPIDSHSILGIAGAPSVAIEVARVLKVSLSAESKIGGSISCDGKVSLLQAIVKQYLPLMLQTNGSMAADFIFTSFDRDKKACRIFNCDPSSWKNEMFEYCAIGSGSPAAIQTLRNFWQDGLSEQEALQLGSKAIKSAAETNAGTSAPYYYFRVNENGFEEIFLKEVKNA